MSHHDFNCWHLPASHAAKDSVRGMVWVNIGLQAGPQVVADLVAHFISSFSKSRRRSSMMCMLMFASVTALRCCPVGSRLT